MSKRKRYNKKSTILIIAVVLIITYIIYAIISLIKSPTDVFVIKSGKVSLDEQAIGYLIREETVVKGNGSQNGIVQIKSEGEKVARGETIFRYYSSYEEQINEQIKEIDTKINKELENQSDLPSSDIKALDKQIEQKIDNLSNCLDTGKIREYKNDINTCLTKKSKIAGEKSTAGSYIKQLYEERSIYEARLNQLTEYVKAPISGVLSYRVDGLENILKTDDFSQITEELLEGLNIKTGQIIATNNQEAKIINNFECYIATVMNTENARNSEIGQNVKIKLSNQEEIDATITHKFQLEDNGVILILKITSNVEELISYRKISFDIIWWSDTGLKVPNSAIIYDDNDRAYIIRNRSGYLDKILIKKVKETKSYTLVENYKTEELKQFGFSTEEIRNMKNVTIYDEIISKPQRQMLQ